MCVACSGLHVLAAHACVLAAAPAALSGTPRVVCLLEESLGLGRLLWMPICCCFMRHLHHCDQPLLSPPWRFIIRSAHVCQLPEMSSVTFSPP